jgi:Domain of unknown function (DUF1905)
VKFKATIHHWKGKSGLAIADVPDNHISALGGLKQRRVRGTINGVEYTSNVWPAGSGRLALTVSQKMMKAGGIEVGDSARFEIEAVQKSSSA